MDKGPLTLFLGSTSVVAMIAVVADLKKGDKGFMKDISTISHEPVCWILKKTSFQWCLALDPAKL